MRSIDLVYATAIVALFVWLTLVAAAGFPDLGATDSRAKTARALAPVSARGAATFVTPSPLSPPRFTASATIDARQFEILVGEGPPAWSVAVSVDD